jgi:large subunit ribosomal protein L6
MAMTDPLGDMLTRIRNGQQARKDSILTPASKLRTHVLDVLQREGYIRGYSFGARVKARSPRLFWCARASPHPQWPRYDNRVDSARRAVGRRGARAECRWRSPGGGVLMSRIGKKPIALPAGVTAALESGTLTVKGPKGQLAMQLLDDLVKFDVAEGEILVTPLTDAQRNRAAWGMQRTMVQNLVTGVTEGFTKVLEISGVGYRAQAQGKNLRLQLGYSHDVNFPVPEGVDIQTPDQNTVEISGIDKQKVGQVAAEIRRWRKPEPYKGKGIKYRGEYIFRKEGKKK